MTKPTSHEAGTQEPVAEEIYQGLQEAKMLIGGKNDQLSEAAKESNINAAWHILDRILAVAAPASHEATRKIGDDNAG
jgi:hypothetical protein